MPEYSSTTITPADSVKTPAMNGSTSGNYTLADLRAFILASKGLANGLASLDANGKLSAAQIPDLADDVIVVASVGSLPASGEADKLYIEKEHKGGYIWDADLGTPAFVKVFSGETEGDLSDLIDGLADGTVIPLKATQDSQGNVIHTTYETKADANDLKNALDANTKRIENLEEKAGDYTEVDVKSVYSVPTGKASNMVLVGVEGRTRVKNNLFSDVVSSSSSVYGITRTRVSSGKLRYQGTATTSTSFTCANLSASDYVSGHLYLLSLGDVVLPSGCRISDSNTDKATASVDTFTDKSLGVYITSGTTVDFTVEPVCTDLNVHFGTSDLSFLGATDSAKLAKIQSDYPWLLTPSSYGTSMVKTRYEGFTSVGVNIWDEDWDNGYLWAGSPASGTNVRSKNYIEVKPNTTYYLCTTAIINISFYDASKNSLSSGTGTQLGAGQTFTTDADTHYIKFFMDSAYGSSYGNNIQIALDSSSAKTTYHPYSKHTLSLPTLIELGSAGSVAEEAYLNEDGEAWKTNPIGHINLGSLTWYYDSGYTRFYADIADAKPTVSEVPANYICAKYLNVSPNVFDLDVPNMAMRGGVGSGMVWIRNTNYSDASTFKTAMDGVYLDYELATPDADTPLTVLTDNLIATEGGGTLEAVKTYPIDDSFTVGYLTL